MVLLTLVGFPLADMEPCFYAFNLPDKGPAAKLAARGVAFLNLSCDRTTEALQEDALRKEKKRKGAQAPQSELATVGYEDRDVQQLADLIARWWEREDARPGEARGDFESGPQRVTGPMVEAPPGTPMITVFYTAVE